MPSTCLENDMSCLFCGDPVRPASQGGGYIRDPEQDGWGAYYLVSGRVSMAEASP